MPAEKKVFAYQLRVWLREISPAIWRRLLVRSDNTITDLHYTLQIAMGWTDWHLHKFTIHGKEYGVSYIGGIWLSDNPDQVKLGDFSFYEKERFVYEYDFGDSWQHEIRVEKHLPLDPKQTYPVCIGGARQAPPEDCGGPWAYMAQKQHYSVWHIEERLLDILAPENLDEDLHDYREELMTFQYWLSEDTDAWRLLRKLGLRLNVLIGMLSIAASDAKTKSCSLRSASNWRLRWFSAVAFCSMLWVMKHGNGNKEKLR